MFPDRLRSLIKENNLTLKSFGSKFNLAESTISGYVTGSRTPDIETIEKFAEFFEVHSDYLRGKTDFRNKEELTEKWQEVADHAKGAGSNEQSAGSGGRAFFGGSDQYSEEELDVARAAIEAYRKIKRKR